MIIQETKGAGSHLVSFANTSLNSSFVISGINPFDWESLLGATVEGWLQMAHDVLPSMEDNNLQAQGLVSCGSYQK